MFGLQLHEDSHQASTTAMATIVAPSLSRPLKRVFMEDSGNIISTEDTEKATLSQSSKVQSPLHP